MSDHILALMTTQIWQIAVLAIVVAVVVKLAAKNRPHLAHALWVLVLIKCVTPPLWGHSLGVFSQLQAWQMPDETAFLRVAGDLPASVPVTIAETLDQASQFDVPDSEHGRPATCEPDDLLSMANTESPEDASLMWNGGMGIELDKAVQLPDEFRVNTAAKSTLPLESVELGASRLSPGWLLLSGVVAGAIMTLFIMVIRCLRCLRLIHRHRTTEFDELLCERIQHLSRQLRIRRIPQIIVSDVLFGPAVLGLLRHTVVLPRCLFENAEGSQGRSFLPERTFAVRRTALGQTSAQRQSDAVESMSSGRVAAGREVLPGRVDLQFLDPILAHELLHIRRGDLRTGTLQAIVQSLWWFHPAVWLSNRWLSREAERCCDEQVIAELGCSPAQYARSLLSVIECKHQLQPIPVFPGMKPVEITSQRMERIMSLKNGLKKRTPLWCWLVILALAFVVLPGAVAKTSVDEVVPNETNGDTEPLEKDNVGTELPEFDGNMFWTDTELRKHLSKRERTEDIESATTFDADCESIKLKYREVGFFDVEVKAQTSPADDPANQTVRFEVKEGSRYTVREVRFEGNNRISASDLQHASNLKPGDKCSAVEISRDIQRIRELYKGLNLEPAAINPVPHFSEESGVVDVVFEIDEGLKALIRLDESFIPSPDMVLTGDTVVAYVADKKITLAHVLIGALSQLEKDTRLTPDQRQQIQRAWVEQRLPAYLYDEVVLHQFEYAVSAEEKTDVRNSVEPRFTVFLKRFEEDRRAKDPERLPAMDGPSAESLHESFVRRQLVESYVKSFPAEAPIRDAAAIESHCRQLLFEARLRQTVSLIADGSWLQSELIGLEDKCGIRISRNAISKVDRAVTVNAQLVDQPLLDVIKAIVEQNGFQVVIGDQEVVITADNWTPHHVGHEGAVIAAKATLQPVVETLEPASIRVYPVADLVVIQQPLIAAVSRSPKNENQATRAVVPASAEAVVPEKTADRFEPMPHSGAHEPAPAANYKADFAPLTELIKATVQPESWEKGLAIHVEEKTLSLIIPQTEKAHQEIQELLSQLRNAQDQNVRIQCTVFQLADGVQSKWLEEQVSLHALQNGTRWALLSQQRSDAFELSLRELTPSVLSAPQVLTISGQTATIQIGSIVGGEKAITGVRLEMTPHLLPDSKVIRMQHSFSIGDFANEMPQPIESLVGSGQTLLLLIDDPEDKEKPAAAKSQYLLMMMPEHIPQKEEEEAASVATPRDAARAVESTDSPVK